MDASIRKEIETPKNPVLQRMTEVIPSTPE
jgi:hypothetical protein